MRGIANRGTGRKKKVSARKQKDATCRHDEAPAALNAPLGFYRDAHARWLANDQRLSDSARTAGLMLLILYASRELYKKHGELVVWPTAHALAKDCGLCKSTAKNAINRLIETGHLSPWTEPVPRRKRDRDDGLNGGRYSDAYVFSDPPPGYAHNWKYFDPLENKQGNVSNPRSGQIKGKHLSNSEVDKSKGHLSNSEGVFVQLQGGFCPTKMKVMPENIELPIPPIEYNTENRDLGNLDSALPQGSPTTYGGDGALRAHTATPESPARGGDRVGPARNSDNGESGAAAPRVESKNGGPESKPANNGDKSATAQVLARATPEPRFPLMEHVLKVVNAELFRHEFIEAPDDSPPFIRAPYSDDFKWEPENGAVIVPEQKAIAVYRNPWGQVVIRAGAAEYGDEDSFVVVSTEHVPALKASPPLVLDRKKLAAFSAAAGRFLQFPIGDRRCNRTRASVGNAGGNARQALQTRL